VLDDLGKIREACTGRLDSVAGIGLPALSA
jgi:hypothetical protein